MIPFAVVLLAAVAQLRADTDGFPLPPGAVARIGSSRFLNGNGFEHCLYSHDGKWLLTVDDELEVSVWNAATGERRLRLQEAHAWPLGAADDVLTIARWHWDDDGESRDWRIERMHMPTRKVLSSVPMPDTATRPLTLSPDGSKIGLVNTDGQTSVIDARTGKELWKRAGQPNCWPYAFTPDGKSIAFNFGSGPQEAGGEAEPTPDEKSIALHRGTGRIDLLDSASGKPLGRFTADGLDAVGSFAFSADGKWLVAVASSGWDTVFVIWDVKTQKAAFSGKTRADWCECAMIGRESQAVLVGKGETEVWDLPTAKRLRSFPTRGRQPLVSPDGKTLVLVCATGLQLYDLATGKRLPQSAELADATLNFAPVPFTPQGKLRASVWVSSGVDPEDFDTEQRHEWNPLTGRITALPPRGASTRRASWSADESRYLKFSGPTANLFDARTGLAIRGFAMDDSIWGVEIDPTGERVLTKSERELVLWGSNGTRRVTIPLRGDDGTHTEAAFQSGGNTLVTLQHRIELTLWDTNTGKSSRTIRLGDAQSRPVFSADGRYFIATPYRANLGKLGFGVNAVDYYSVRPALFNAATGQELYQFPVRKSWRSTPSYCFSPDGRIVAVGQDDGKIVLVETTFGQVVTIFNQGDPAEALHFSPGGRWLASSGTGTLLVWDVGTRLNQLKVPPKP